MCVFCGGLWYCPLNPPERPCPDNGVGPCDDDAGGCLACNIDGVAVGSCACVRDTTGNFTGGEVDGGPDYPVDAESDAPLTWNCTSTMFGCRQ